MGNILGAIGSALGGINPLIGAGLISGIGSLGASLYSASQSQKQSKELMDYQYQLQQKAIDAANLYNHPAQQMKRLAEAGLSPNLVYGSGVDGNQSSPASPGIANRKVDVSNPLQDLGQNYLQSKQLQLQEIATRNQAFESRSRRQLNEARTLGVLSDNTWKDKTLDTRIEHAKQKLVNDMTRQSILEQTSNNMRVQANILVEQADLIAAKQRLTQEQALTEVVKRKAIEKGMQLTQAQISQAASYIEYLEAGTKLRKLGHRMQNTAFDATKAYQEWRKDHPNASLTIDMVKEILGAGESVAKIAGAFIP